jgi:hypothetical protein
MTGRFVSTSACFLVQRGYFSGTLPQLDVVSVDQLLGGSDGSIVVVADQRLGAVNMAVVVCRPI